MLYTLIVVVHVFICFLMIGAILLQSGKGAEIGCLWRVEPNGVAVARLTFSVS